MADCKYCLGPCINDCANKIIKRICPKCGISYPKLYTFTRHLERKTSCIEEIQNKPEIKTINLAEISIMNNFNNEEQNILKTNEILKKLMDRYDELLKKYILLENKYNYTMKQNSEYKLKNIIEGIIEPEEIELLFDMIIEETDNKIIKYTIERFKNYNECIYKFIEENKLIKYSIEEINKLLEYLSIIMNEKQKNRLIEMKNRKNEENTIKKKDITLYF